VGADAARGGVFTLAPDPEFDVFECRPDVLEPVEDMLPARRQSSFSAASVSAVEPDVEHVEENAG